MPRIGIGIGLGRTFYAGSFADAYNARVLADGGTIEATPCVNAASTLLQSASLLLIPSGYKSGVAYSQLPNNGNGDLTWTRASTANRTNSSGLIESVSSGVPRLSYMYGSCPALLLEPQRTNLALRSNELSTAPNVLDGVTATTNFYNSPDGTTNAIRLAETTANDRHGFFQYYSVTAQTYTISVFAKQIGRRYICLMSDLNGTNTYSFFDLQNKVVVSSGSGYTCTIQEFSDGWLRLSATVTAVSGSRYTIWGGSTNGTTNTYVGSTSTFMSFYGLQLEVGAYATTYIPTTSATATRVADSFSRNNIYTNGLITSSGGTWYVELKNNVSYTRDSLNRFGVGDTIALTTNSIYLFPAATGRFSIGKYILGSQTTLYTTTTDAVKIAIKWNGTTADVFVNGTKQVSATIFTTTLIEYLIGGTSATLGTPTFIQSMALFSTPLSDADCAAITSL